MKNLRKILSMVIAVVMVLGMSITAMADDTYTITIDSTEAGHTYEAYQIFTGDLSGTTLSNIQWGTNISEDGKTALRTRYTLAADATAADVAEKMNQSEATELAEIIGDYLTGSPAGTTDYGTDGNYTIDGLQAGYYLVKDMDSSLQGTTLAYTSYILKVAGDVTVEPKSDVPTVVKKVQDTDDTAGTTTDWQDSADYDIGDNVPFQLTATLASNVSDYDTYKVEFVDTLSAGLTYNNDAVVKMGDTVVTEYFDITNNGNLVITCDDVKAFGATDNSVITVEYTAQLNDSAVLGSAGNPNTVKLVYSNNPNNSGSGNNETGETVTDTVIVFTYKVVVNKIDEESQPLAGAEFELVKKISDGSEKTIAVVKNPEGTKFTFSGLDDGTYVLKETVTPAGYNSISDIEFKVEAGHVISADMPTLDSLTGTATSGQISFNANLTEGSLTADVVNGKGAELPSTGGMGTRVIYTIGGILMVVCVVGLVTKRRMSNH